MDVREKLVEIMEDLGCNDEYCKDCEFCNDIDGCVHRQKEIIADRLIANGVTVQEWISVKDRLPIEEAKAHEQEWPGEYCEFLVMIEKGSLPTTLYYDLGENEWFRINTALERETYEVTNWMPLPEPPKEE